MDLSEAALRVNRRHFFGECLLSLGSCALLAANAPGATALPPSSKPTHFPARAKRVIFLFMAGGPSQYEPAR